MEDKNKETEWEPFSSSSNSNNGHRSDSLESKLDPKVVADEEEKDFETGNPVDDNEENVDEREDKEKNKEWQPFVPKEEEKTENNPDNSDWISPEGKGDEKTGEALIKPNEAEAVVDVAEKYGKPVVQELTDNDTAEKVPGDKNLSTEIEKSGEKNNPFDKALADKQAEIERDKNTHGELIREEVEAQKKIDDLKKEEEKQVEYLEKTKKLIDDLQKQIKQIEDELNKKRDKRFELEKKYGIENPSAKKSAPW